MNKTRSSPGPSVGGEKERQQPLDPAAEGISDVDDHHNRHDRQDGEKIAEHQTAPGTRGAHLVRGRDQSNGGGGDGMPLPGTCGKTTAQPLVRFTVNFQVWCTTCTEQRHGYQSGHEHRGFVKVGPRYGLTHDRNGKAPPAVRQRVRIPKCPKSTITWRTHASINCAPATQCRRETSAG